METSSANTTGETSSTARKKTKQERDDLTLALNKFEASGSVLEQTLTSQPYDPAQGFFFALMNGQEMKAVAVGNPQTWANMLYTLCNRSPEFQQALLLAHEAITTPS